MGTRGSQLNRSHRLSRSVAASAAIWVALAVGIMVAIGGEGDGSDQIHGGVRGVQAELGVGVPRLQTADGAVLPYANDGPILMGEAPELEAPPTRLVIGGLATADGEPAVTAATVEPTRDIVEPTPTHKDYLSVGPANIIALIVQYDWPDDTAIAIADCESDFNPNAVNPQPVILNNGVNHASGVFQLLMPLHTWRLEGASPFDAEANIRAAYGMWLTDGWGPWKECW